jgi:hypothetical protein
MAGKRFPPVPRALCQLPSRPLCYCDPAPQSHLSRSQLSHPHPRPHPQPRIVAPLPSIPAPIWSRERIVRLHELPSDIPPCSRTSPRMHALPARRAPCIAGCLRSTCREDQCPRRRPPHQLAPSPNHSPPASRSPEARISRIFRVRGAEGSYIACQFGGSLFTVTAVRETARRAELCRALPRR